MFSKPHLYVSWIFNGSNHVCTIFNIFEIADPCIDRAIRNHWDCKFTVIAVLIRWWSFVTVRWWLCNRVIRLFYDRRTEYVFYRKIVKEYFFYKKKTCPWILCVGSVKLHMIHPNKWCTYTFRLQFFFGNIVLFWTKSWF